MAKRRKTVFDENKVDPEVTMAPTIDMNTLEIRGQGKKWHLYYPDPSNYQTSIPIKKDGEVIGSAPTWVATNKLIEVHEVFTSEGAAKDAAEFIRPGCEIKVIKTSIRRKKKEEDNGE